MIKTPPTSSRNPSLPGAGRKQGPHPKRVISTKQLISTEPIRAAEQHAAECTLARLIALAYAADYPSLFLPPAREEDGQSADSDLADVPGSTITA
jgi:hypothetical protein